jgi:hypothetical protein
MPQSAYTPHTSLVRDTDSPSPTSSDATSSSLPTPHLPESISSTMTSGLNVGYSSHSPIIASPVGPDQSPTMHVHAHAHSDVDNDMIRKESTASDDVFKAKNPTGRHQILAAPQVPSTPPQPGLIPSINVNSLDTTEHNDFAPPSSSRFSNRNIAETPTRPRGGSSSSSSAVQASSRTPGIMAPPPLPLHATRSQKPNQLPTQNRPFQPVAPAQGKRSISSSSSSSTSLLTPHWDTLYIDRNA